MISIGKIFTSFCLVGTVLLIAHSNIISLFSILAQKWVKHFFYDNEILDLFRSSHGNEVTALFKDQTIKIIKQQKIANTGEDQEPWVEDKSKEIKIKDKLVDYHFDRENNEWVIFVTQVGAKEDVTYHVNALYHHKLYDITEQFCDEFRGKPNLVFLFSVNEHTEFIVQHHHQIDLYTIDFEEIKDEDEEEAAADELEGDKEEGEEGEDVAEAKVKEVKKKLIIKAPVVRPLQTNIDVTEKDEHGHISKKIIKRKISDGVKF